MLILADARHLPIADGCVQCVVTSPPYWGLRDYNTPDQIGLERTPDEYVQTMVAVFREVRRVLKDDGVAWLNLGDSYASGEIGRHDSRTEQAENYGARMSGPRQQMRLRGCKPKDLVGIPWRVAFALQAPWYDGTIHNAQDRAWLAALLEAEGCLFVHKRKAGQHNGQGYYRQNDSYSPGVEICNTSLALIERIKELVGKGSINVSERGRFGRKQTLYRWNLRTIECRDFVRELYPHLVAKRQQARLLCGCPSSGDKADAAHRALMGLHNGIDTDVDFPAPASCFTPGWYLRSDIIWAKNNPMPESVTDRPTKSHEYLFLLAKAERYYYDADAIAEGLSDESVGRYQRAVDNREVFDPARHKHAIGDAKIHRAPMEILTQAAARVVERGTRNKRSVWTIPTKPYPGAHFATMPEALVEPCILAGSKPGDLVLDPFCGTGTVGRVALRHGRRFVGTDLNPTYLRDLAPARLSNIQTVLPLQGEVA